MFIHRHLFIGIYASHYTLMITQRLHTTFVCWSFVGTQNDVTVTACEKRRGGIPHRTSCQHLLYLFLDNTESKREEAE